MRIATLTVGLSAGLAVCFPAGSQDVSTPGLRPRSRAALVDLNTDSLVPDVIYTTPLRGITHMRLAIQESTSPLVHDEIATDYQALWPVKSTIDGHTAASALSRAQQHIPGGAYQNITALSRYSTQYGIECMWGDQPIWLLFDTGSSDTWAVKSDFICTDRYDNEYPQAACRHGVGYVNEFAHGKLPNLHFALSFGSGERVSGPMGLSDITVGGITVDQVQVGLANRTYWRGNNITDGILGLAFGALTSAYYGSEDENREQYRVPYSPFVSTMISQGKLKNRYFSVAIERNSSSGIMAWGGLPPTQLLGNSAAATDLIITNINPTRTESAWKYSYYTIVVDGMQWEQTVDTRKYLYIVDTGTTLNYLPPPIAESIAAAFEPRAVFLWQYGGYFAPCDASPPIVSVIIGGQHLYIDPKDLIYQDIKDLATGYCQIGIASGGEGPYILGDVFLQNVVAVFDVGRAQMRFYSRNGQKEE